MATCAITHFFSGVLTENGMTGWIQVNIIIILAWWNVNIGFQLVDNVKVLFRTKGLWCFSSFEIRYVTYLLSYPFLTTTYTYSNSNHLKYLYVHTYALYILQSCGQLFIGFIFIFTSKNSVVYVEYIACCLQIYYFCSICMFKT